jgi:hypothetical protein
MPLAMVALPTPGPPVMTSILDISDTLAGQKNPVREPREYN